MRPTKLANDDMIQLAMCYKMVWQNVKEISTMDAKHINKLNDDVLIHMTNLMVVASNLVKVKHSLIKHMEEE